PVVIPAADLQSAVAGICNAASRDADAAARAAAGFRDFATVLDRTPDAIRTHSQLRQVMQSFEQILWRGTDMAGRLGLSSPMNDALTAAFGVKDSAIDHRQAVDFVRAVAWALEGGR